MEPIALRQVQEKGASGAVCPHFHAAIELIGKRWTGAIVCALTERPMRFGELGKAVPGLSDRLLSQRLRELEEEGLVEREVEAGNAGAGHLLADRGGAAARPGPQRAQDLGAGVGRKPRSFPSAGRGPDLPGPFAVGTYARRLQE